MDKYVPYEENYQGNFPLTQGGRDYGENYFDPTWQRPQTTPQTTTLFLGDLSVICDEENLYDLFRHYGDIETIQLKKSDRDPQRAHLGFGFIKFSTRESAERAMQDLNGYFYLGRAMRVGWADDYDKRRGGAVGLGGQQRAFGNKKNRQTAQIHVMFVSRELNRRVSELDLGGVFGQFGNLVDIAIKKNAINPEYQVQSGYAFIHYNLTHEGIQSAVSAVEQINNRSIDDISYQCKVTHSLQAQILSMKYRGPSTHREPNTYFGNGELIDQPPVAGSSLIHQTAVRGREPFFRNPVPSAPASVNRFEPFVPQHLRRSQEAYDTYGAPPSLGSNTFDRLNNPPAPPSFSSSTYDKSLLYAPTSELGLYNSNDFFASNGEAHPPSLSIVHDVLRDEEDDDLGTTSISANTTVTHTNTRNSSLNSVKIDQTFQLTSEKEFMP